MPDPFHFWSMENTGRGCGTCSQRRSSSCEYQWLLLALTSPSPLLISLPSLFSSIRVHDERYHPLSTRARAGVCVGVMKQQIELMSMHLEKGEGVFVQTMGRHTQEVLDLHATMCRIR